MMNRVLMNRMTKYRGSIQETGDARALGAFDEGYGVCNDSYWLCCGWFNHSKVIVGR